MLLPNGLGIGVVGPTTLWASIYCMRLGSTNQWATNVYDMGWIRDGTFRNRDKPRRGMSRRVGHFIMLRCFWHSGFITLGCFIPFTFCARTFYRCIFAVIVICLYVAYVPISSTIQMNYKSFMKTKLTYAIYRGYKAFPEEIFRQNQTQGINK